MCTNKGKGCEWQGEINRISNHHGNSDGCQFEDVKCSNECGKMLQRQYLTSHVETECPRRTVDCQYCHIIGEYQFIMGEHKEQCPKVPLPCPNKCQAASIFREDIEEHRKECPLEDVQCLNVCGEMLKRQILKSHMELECACRKVNCQCCHITGEHQFIEGEHKEQCPKLMLPCPNKCDIESVCREEMEAHRKECLLEMVQCEYHSMGCEERVMRKYLENHEEENVKQHLSLTRSELDNTAQQMVDTQKKLTDTQEDLSTIKDELTDTKTQLDDALKQIKRLMILMNQNATTDRRPYYTNDAVSNISGVRWSALLAVTALTTSGGQVCPVIMRLRGYSKNMKNQVIRYTESFYSHNEGYNMCLRVDAAGSDDGKGTHLSLYLYLTKGPYDGNLTWPLKGKFEFKLLNQISDHEHYVQTLTYDGSGVGIGDKVIDNEISEIGFGFSQFISNGDLNKATRTCQYLKDDCIFLQVSKL